jgi:hypothetical protein
MINPYPSGDEFVSFARLIAMPSIVADRDGLKIAPV